MTRQSIDFRLDGNTGYFWLAPRDLGGRSLVGFIKTLVEDGEVMAALFEQGHAVLMSTYEEDLSARALGPA